MYPAGIFADRGPGGLGAENPDAGPGPAQAGSMTLELPDTTRDTSPKRQRGDAVNLPLACASGWCFDPAGRLCPVALSFSQESADRPEWSGGRCGEAHSG